MGGDSPIGVFDSGVGGLTVLRALHRSLPRESTIYLGDTARVPYGPKSPDTVLRYAREAAAFLTGRGVKGIVIACNTATAHAKRALTDALEIPVIGVVEPGAAAAAAASRSGAIGVIGTRGTIESGTYERAILRARPDASVFSEPCPLFVALAEEGWVDGDVAELTTRRYLEPLVSRGIDTLLLGCTHYPLLAPLIERVVGPEVELVDSATATARATAARLDERGLAAADREARREYYVTDDEARFSEIADRFLGAPARRVARASLGDVSP
ncbi:MAG: glutamate racemase [Gemmatimonadetes bacterium]|nr:glutamate racemase [Gemmatimonadota bacterium]